MTTSRRVNGYYGNAPIDTDTNDDNVFGTKSYSKAVSTSSDHNEVVRLSHLVDDLAAQVEALKKNVFKEVTGIVLKDVDKKLENMETRVNERITEVETNCNTQLGTISQQYADILDKMSTNNSTLLAAIRGDPVTPSGVDDSARGGAQ